MSENLIIALITHGPVTAAAVVGMWFTLKNRKTVKAIYTATNGNLEALLTAARLEGALTERYRREAAGGLATGEPGSTT